jgi:hypothetical protein
MRTQRAIVGDMLTFTTYISLGYRRRNDPAVHKRLMLFATFALLNAGFDRWSVFDPYPLAVVNLTWVTPLPPASRTGSKTACATTSAAMPVEYCGSRRCR